MPKDIRLIRWSNLLLALAIICALLAVAVPVYIIFSDAPIVLLKENGKTAWNTTFNALPAVDRVVVFALTFSSSVAWLYGLLQIARLAVFYRQGAIFEFRNARCFIHLGGAFVIIAILETVTGPLINVFLYWRGISPWLGSMPVLFAIKFDYLMAGVFFFVLGKIMIYGNELEESDRMIV